MKNFLKFFLAVLIFIIVTPVIYPHQFSGFLPDDFDQTKTAASLNESSNRFWSAGASVGTSFAAPWMIATVRGTAAPLNHTFLELGLDFGLIHTAADVEKYHSMYPFAHFAWYRPFGNIGGFYLGAGGGCMMLYYTFPEGEYTENIFTGGLTAGVNLFDMLNIAWTLRTNFQSASNKLSVGYIYRFRGTGKK